MAVWIRFEHQRIQPTSQFVLQMRLPVGISGLLIGPGEAIVRNHGQWHLSFNAPTSARPEVCTGRVLRAPVPRAGAGLDTWAKRRLTPPATPRLGSSPVR